MNRFGISSNQGAVIPGGLPHRETELADVVLRIALSRAKTVCHTNADRDLVAVNVPKDLSARSESGRVHTHRRATRRRRRHPYVGRYLSLIHNVGVDDIANGAGVTT